MKRTVKLRTNNGNEIQIILENWGSGLDRAMRRWTLQEGLWQCVDSGELAEQAIPGFRKSVPLSHDTTRQDTNRAVGEGHERTAAAMRGQTMVEYALIIAAVGAVALGACTAAGQAVPIHP